MRHRKKGVILDRPKGQREALLKGLVNNLVLYEHITTTRAKAKAVRPLAERLVTRAKNNTIAAKRYVAARVLTDGARRKLFEVLGPRYKERAGGYTRSILMRRRAGDGAQMTRVEFV